MKKTLTNAALFPIRFILATFYFIAGLVAFAVGLVIILITGREEKT